MGGPRGLASRGSVAGSARVALMAPDRSWRRAARDAAPVALALALCPLVAAMAPGPAGPIERIEDLVSVERSMGLLFEPAVHHWVALRPWLMSAFELGYVGVHLPVMLGTLLWVWFARPAAFRHVRNMFVSAQAMLAAGYVLVPTAPPRMVASLGYHGVVDVGSKGLERLAMSPYAALPSGHAAFAAMVTGTVVCLARNPVVRGAALLYPPLVLVEIFATGNHIWLDAVAGVSVAALALGLARVVERRAAPELQPEPQPA